MTYQEYDPDVAMERALQVAERCALYSDDDRAEAGEQTAWGLLSGTIPITASEREAVCANEALARDVITLWHAANFWGVARSWRADQLALIGALLYCYGGDDLYTCYL